MSVSPDFFFKCVFYKLIQVKHSLWPLVNTDTCCDGGATLAHRELDLPGFSCNEWVFLGTRLSAQSGAVGKVPCSHFSLSGERCTIREK